MIMFIHLVLGGNYNYYLIYYENDNTPFRIFLTIPPHDQLMMQN